MIKKKILFIAIVIIISFAVFHFCCPSTERCSYYCPDNDFFFQIEEDEDNSILIFGQTDSVFLRPLNGLYWGIEFYVLEDSKTIYLSDIIPTPIKIVQNRFNIKFIQRDNDFKLDLSPLGESYWMFCGEEDRRNRTFDYSHKGQDYQWHFLSPLEKK